MTDADARRLLNDVLPAIARHKTTRRKLLTEAAVAAGAAAGAGLVGRPSRRQTADAATLALVYGLKGHGRFRVTDDDILNFALNLEYLEAEFYQRAAYGAVLGTTDITGTGTQGTVTGGSAGGVHRPDRPAVRPGDRHRRVEPRPLPAGGPGHGRRRPAVDRLHRRLHRRRRQAGVVTTGGPSTRSRATSRSCSGRYIFEDVGVTAYQGGSPYIKNPTYLAKAAGILTVEGYHAADVRTTLYRMATAPPRRRPTRPSSSRRPTRSPPPARPCPRPPTASPSPTRGSPSPARHRHDPQHRPGQRQRHDLRPDLRGRAEHRLPRRLQRRRPRPVPAASSRPA